MPCNFPRRAWQKGSGLPVSFSPGGKLARTIHVPCGKCNGCRLDYSRDWAIRCVHESQLHCLSSFVTLTYRDEHLPPGGSLRYEDFRLFLRRVRRGVPKVRFFMCGEYGKLLRPHFHALLFGVWFPDRVQFKVGESGAIVYRSDSLDKLWGLGFCTVGDVNFESAGYIARYVMKRGEVDIGSRVPEFVEMSVRPGIGRKWLEKFHSDVYPHGEVTHAGREVSPPRYYDKWYKAFDLVSWEKLTRKRSELADRYFDDNGPRRLRDKECVLEARLKVGNKREV